MAHKISTFVNSFDGPEPFNINGAGIANLFSKPNVRRYILPHLNTLQRRSR